MKENRSFRMKKPAFDLIEGLQQVKKIAPYVRHFYESVGMILDNILSHVDIACIWEITAAFRAGVFKSHFALFRI